MASHEMNQADWRRDRNIRDQFGRLWLVSFETTPTGGGSNMPTGQISTADWRDPLATPQEYLRIPTGEFGEPDRNKLDCDLRPWAQKQRGAEAEWKKRLYDHGQRHYKAAFNPHTAEEDDFLMTLAGPKPWPPSITIIRAMNGDRAMLGLAPLTREDRELLGQETDEDLGFASEPRLAEANPSLPPTPPLPPRRAVPSLTYWKFVAKLKAEGVTDPQDIKAHWLIYKDEMATDGMPQA